MKNILNYEGENDNEAVLLAQENEQFQLLNNGSLLLGNPLASSVFAYPSNKL